MAKNRYDSGLDDLKDITYGGATTFNTAYQPQPFTPRPHNPLITPSQGADASWAGGEGWSEKEFGGSGWTYGGANKGTRGINFPFGGRRSYAGFSEDDLKRLLKYDKMVWERSTPDVTGVGGTVRWDRDKNMVTSALSEENQAIYDAMYERQKRFGAEADAFSGTGWQDAQQKRFDQKRALYAESDAAATWARKERELATGASSTGMFLGEMIEQQNINRRNQILEEAAFNESQGLIDSAQRRQGLDIDSMRTLGSIANSMVVTPTPNTAGNMANVSKASTDWADALVMDALKKQQGNSDFWKSIVSGISGGMFT